MKEPAAKAPAASADEPPPDRPCPAEVLAAVVARATELHGKGVDVGVVADAILGGIGIVEPKNLSENEARAVIRALEGKLAARKSG